MKDYSESATTVRPAVGPVVAADDRLAGDAAGIVDVVLEGGPADLPPGLRSHRVTQVAEKIKIQYNGGYEHFGRDSPVDVVDVPVVFRWTGRTRIAE